MLGDVSTRRLRRLAAFSWIPLLGCVGNLCGPDPGPPEIADCDPVDASSSFDALEVAVRREFGPQGGEMLMFDATFLGADPPTCALLEWSAFDLDTGEVVASGPDQVETTEVDGGRRTRSSIWRFWPSPARSLRVEVTAHGQMASATYCADDGSCGAADAGP